MRFCLLALLIGILAATACATAHKERAVSQDIIVANYLCGGYAVHSQTNDKEGDRMVCGWEEFTGTHVPKCVCHDEKKIFSDREMAQQYLRDIERGMCVSQGSGDCRQ